VSLVFHGSRKAQKRGERKTPTENPSRMREERGDP